MLIEIEGGQISSGLLSDDLDRIFVSGRAILGELRAIQGGELVVRGGGGFTRLHAFDSSLSETPRIVVEGQKFAVGGIPVGYGVLAPGSGTLTGTLASGEGLAVDFLIDGSTFGGLTEQDWDSSIELVDSAAAASVPIASVFGALARILLLCGLGTHLTTRRAVV